ncbi:MAG: FRG domain-containing protein [Candidatus Poribacteria bacterium]|nr:FRG domain-containing protein [Candidatus Poribacteria bacterium]
MNDKTNSENQSRTIDEIINEIKQKSSNGDYIYRGERKQHCKISSALYREYFDDKNINVDLQGLDLRNVQRGMLNAAKKHIGESPQGLEDSIGWTFKSRPTEQPGRRVIIDTDELEILTELQHYGGITNLIDFTTDYLIAIFFACTGDLKETEDGRVILLEKTPRMEEELLIRPQNPRHRVIAQKSIFLYPPHGFIDVHEDHIVYIPSDLKQPMQKYLRKYHDISPETIYNDLHGFITNQKNHQEAAKEFHFGLILQYKGYRTEPGPKKQKAYKDAMLHYERAIKLNSDPISLEKTAYYKLGVCRMHLEEWEKAWENLMIADNMGVHLPAEFHKDYPGGIDEFKKETGIEIRHPFTVLLGY